MQTNVQPTQTPEIDMVSQVANRADRLIGSFTNAIMATAEAAAERIELAAGVVRVQQRMAAFGAVLETIDAEKRAIQQELATADGPAKALLGMRVKLLTDQEVSILQRAGVDQAQAQQAVAVTDKRMAPASANGHASRRRHASGRAPARV